jgi:hypothetical protein
MKELIQTGEKSMEREQTEEQMEKMSNKLTERAIDEHIKEQEEKKGKRLDQDIHFSLGTVRIHMKLDTTAPFTRWILTPENPEDIKNGHFAEAVRLVIARGWVSGVVNVQSDHASINLENNEGHDGSLQNNIFASLPEWNGESLDGLIGVRQLAEFLLYLESRTGIIGAAFEGFQRSDGRKIEYDSFLK